jgi:hypothetical protein
MSIVIAIFLAALIGVCLGFQAAGLGGTDTVRRLWKQRLKKEGRGNEDKSNGDPRA